LFPLCYTYLQPFPFPTSHHLTIFIHISFFYHKHRGRRMLVLIYITMLDGITSRMTMFFIVTTIRTSNLTQDILHTIYL
jgi:hypothetical protein